MDRAAACSLLGIPDRELVAVDDSPAGPVITTTDGQRYILVDASTPDADGAYGLMFLAAPSDTYAGAMAVYAQPGAVATEVPADGQFDEDSATALATGLAAAAGQITAS